MTGVIYTLVDPRTLEIRYIGKSIHGIKRAHDHCRPSSIKEGNTPKNNWIKGLLEINLRPIVGTLFSVKYDVTEKHSINKTLYAKEQEYISLLKDRGMNLTNLTDGGEGAVGRIIDTHTRKKMSDLAKNRPLPKALIDNQKSKYPDDKIEDDLVLRFCKKCNLFKLITHFRKDKATRVRTCNKCKCLTRPSRSVPGAKQAYDNKRKIAVTAYIKDTELHFDGMRDAAKSIGSKCNRLGIKKAIVSNTKYYNYFWKFK